MKENTVNFKQYSKIRQSQNVKPMEHEIKAISTENTTQNEREVKKNVKIVNWVMNVASHNMSCHLIYSSK